MNIESKADVEAIPDRAYDGGFNEYYETDDGEQVAVPAGSTVPSEWTLIAD